MKQAISALMDGELFEDETDALFDKIKRHPDADQEWLTYHLIKDALRQPDHVHADILYSFHERLDAEPTVFAPHSRITQKTRNYALSAAASVLAIALVVWLSVKVDSEPTARLAIIELPSTNAIRPASLSANDYLMAHQEFSPNAEVQGVASYIHTVTARQ
jgi:sigma-E factor negative regulatory protein RseA